MAKPTGYMAYLVRLWQEKHDGQQIWRASVEQPGQTNKHAFQSFEALVDFLAHSMQQAEKGDIGEG